MKYVSLNTPQDLQRFEVETQNFIREQIVKAEEFVNKKIDESFVEYFRFANNKYKEIFHEAVKEFYDSYSPSLYVRNHSLYELITARDGEDDLGRYISIGFDSDKTTKYRKQEINSDGLYDTVFKEGWHGGAKSGPKHPDIGTPYWRYPKPYYSTWFNRKADRSPISPFDSFVEKKEKYESEEAESVFNGILQRKLDQ